MYLDPNTSPDDKNVEISVYASYALIILQTINEVVLVYIINIFYLWILSMFNICKNVLSLYYLFIRFPFWNFL